MLYTGHTTSFRPGGGVREASLHAFFDLQNVAIKAVKTNLPFIVSSSSMRSTAKSEARPWAIVGHCNPAYWTEHSFNRFLHSSHDNTARNLPKSLLAKPLQVVDVWHGWLSLGQIYAAAEVLANSHAEKRVFIGPTKISAYTRENPK